MEGKELGYDFEASIHNIGRALEGFRAPRKKPKRLRMRKREQKDSRYSTTSAPKRAPVNPSQDPVK